MDKGSLEYQVYAEAMRKINLKSKLSRSSYYKPTATSQFQLHRERQQKRVIDEINRLNLTSDYGV